MNQKKSVLKNAMFVFILLLFITSSIISFFFVFGFKNTNAAEPEPIGCCVYKTNTGWMSTDGDTIVNCNSLEESTFFEDEICDKVEKLKPTCGECSNGNGCDYYTNFFDLKDICNEDNPKIIGVNIGQDNCNAICQQQNTINISGIVEYVGGEKIKGTKITFCDNYQTYTNENGAFNLLIPSQDLSCTLKATKDEMEYTTTLPANQNHTNLLIQFEYKPLATLEGTIIDYHTGKEISGASIVLSKGDYSKFSISDNSGKYILIAYQDEGYQLITTKQGYKTNITSNFKLDEETKTKDITLYPLIGTEFNFIVLDLDSREPIENAEVKTLQDGETLSAKTNSNGETTLTLSIGKIYPIVVSATGYIINTTSIETTQSSEQFEIKLKKSTTTCSPEGECVAQGVRCTEQGITQQDETCCLSSEGFGWYNGFCVQLDSFCKNDCTFGIDTNSDGVCHAECDGINGCSFSNSDISFCDEKQAGTIFDYNTQKIYCCEGPIGVCSNDIEQVDCSNPLCRGNSCLFDTGEGEVEGICGDFGECVLPQCQENSCGGEATEDVCMCGTEIAFKGDYCCAGGSQIYDTEQKCKEDSVCAESECSLNGGNCCSYGGEGTMLEDNCPGESQCYSGECNFDKTYICSIEAQCNGEKSYLSNGRIECSVPCTPLPKCSETIRETETELGACVCGETSVYTTGNNNYCCDGIINTEGCGLGINFNGKVINSITKEGIEYATVSLKKEVVSEGKSYFIPIKTILTDNEGIFLLNTNELEKGDYKIYGAKQGFSSSNINIEVTGGETSINIDNIYLDPLFICDNSQLPFAKAVRGEKAIHLSWDELSEDCRDQVDYIEINKTYPDATNKLITISGAATDYTDYDVDWDTDYLYSLVYHYKYSGAKETKDKVTGNAGMSICEGKEEDDSFCYNSNVASCDENNFPQTIDTCGSIGTFASTCVENPTTSPTTAECRIAGACEATTQQSLFGMFYFMDNPIDKLNSCYSVYEPTNTPVYKETNCYYDYSLTNINSCYDCSDLKSIYNYKSKQSCEEDRCGAYNPLHSWNNPYSYSTGNKTHWMYLGLGELGRGICYQYDYDSSEYCHLLSEDIFTSMENSEEVCRALGNCYPASYKCEECDYSPDGTKCEEFKTKETCVGSQTIGGEHSTLWDNTNWVLNPSNDACHLGLCAWNESNNSCYKDADGDELDDCTGYSGIDLFNCKADYTIPEINLTNTFLSTKQPYFEFKASEKISNITLKINENILNNDTISSASFSINNSFELEDGLYNISYYGEDVHNNPMNGKTQLIYVDYSAPEIVFLFNTTYDNETKLTLFNADLYSNEYAVCDVSLIKDNAAEFSIKDMIIDKGYKTLLNNPLSLNDGFYNLEASCIDAYGNKAEYSQIIWLDNNRKIIPINPAPYERVNYKERDNFIFKIETLDETNCTLSSNKKLNNTLNANEKYKMNSTDNLIHSFNVGSMLENKYEIEFVCTDIHSGEDNTGITQYDQKTDTEKIMFYNDNSPPTTTFTTSSDNNLFYLDSNKNNLYALEPVKLEFTCNDFPEGFYDDPSSKCEVYVDGEQINTKTISSFGKHTINYYSTDKIINKNPNIEQTKKLNVYIGEPTEIELSVENSKGTKVINGVEHTLLGGGNYNLQFSKKENPLWKTRINYSFTPWIYDEYPELYLSYDEDTEKNTENKFNVSLFIPFYENIENPVFNTTLKTNLLDNYGLPIKIINPLIIINQTKPNNPEVVYPRFIEYNDLKKLYVNSKSSQQIIGYDGGLFGNINITVGISKNEIKDKTISLIDTNWDKKQSTLTKNIGNEIKTTTLTLKEKATIGTNIIKINNFGETSCDIIMTEYPFILFGNSIYDRNYITSENLFYEITNCEEIENKAKLKLTLKQKIENEVPKSTEVHLFDSKYPQGRFELNPNILGIEGNEFYYYIFAKNELDFISENPVKLKVVLDNRTPHITNIKPTPDSLSADEITKISFDIHENITGDYSGLDEKSLIVTLTFYPSEENTEDLIYSEGFGCENNEFVSCEISKDIDKKITSLRYTIKNSTKIDLSKYGKYSVSIDIRDNAINELQKEFWIARDKNTPFTPEVSVSPAPSCNPSAGQTLNSETIYTSSDLPNVSVDFTKTNNVEILITHFLIDGVEYITGNSFNKTFKVFDEGEELTEGLHQIQINARKKKEYETNAMTFNEKYYEQESTTNLKLAVDNTPPETTLNKVNYLNLFNYGKQFNISGYCDDPNNGAEGVDYITIKIFGYNNTPDQQNTNTNSKTLKDSFDLTCNGGTYNKEYLFNDDSYENILMESVAVDKTCHQSLPVEQVLNLDNQKPTINIEVPSKIPVNYTRAFINATDNFGLRKLKVEVLGGEVQEFDLLNEDGSIDKTTIKNAMLSFSEQGTYTIRATVEDLVGNKESATHVVEYDDFTPLIDIIQPKIDVLPNKAIVNEHQLNIKIKPQTEVEGCVYSNKPRSDNFYNLLNKMNDNGDGTYSINYAFDGDSTKIYFKCDYFGTILNKNISLIYDDTPPKIQLIKYEPNPVVEKTLEGNLETKAMIQTDDYTKCMYSSTPSPDIYFPSGEEPISLSTNWEKTFTDLNDKQIYTFYYQCENGVGLKTEVRNATFKTNTSILGEISSLEPIGCLNKEKINITLKTNKISNCNLKYGGVIFEDKPSSSMNTPMESNWATEHLYELNLIKESSEIEANCEFISGAEKSKKFTVKLDKTQPTINSILFDENNLLNNQPITNLEDKIKFKINATTDCYPVDEYYYTLLFSSIELINKTTEKEEIEINPNSFKDLFENYTEEEYISLLNESTLLLKVVASNENGESNEFTQDIFVDTSFTPADCFDGIQNGDEEGVDCGGSCDVSCLGGACNSTSQCVFPAQCNNGVCSIGNYSHCDNNIKDSDETDIDCGGITCLACEVGMQCDIDSDCNSMYCDNETNTCQTPSCNDGVKNGDETDIDCGGSCDVCEFGESCEYNSDCITNYCEQTTTSCQYPTCDDGVKNGNETDVDCGGNCEVCEEGQECILDEDCSTNYCTDGTCTQDPTSDSDNDGLPDFWEQKYFGCKTCADPNEDPDNDGKTNIQEYMEGTDPTVKGEIQTEMNLIALTLLLLGVFLIIGPGIYLLYKQQAKQNRITNNNIPSEQNLLKYKSPKITPQNKNQESLMDKNAYLNYIKKKWDREKETFKKFKDKQNKEENKKNKEQFKEKTQAIKIQPHEYKVETPVYDKYKGRYLTLAELKQKNREQNKKIKSKSISSHEKDIFDQLEDIKKLSKSNKQVNKKLESVLGEVKSKKEITKEDVFVKLSDAFGINTDAFSKLDEIIEKSTKTISEKQLLDAFTSMSIHDKKQVNKNIFKIILSYLLKTGKITKKDVSQLMFDLEKRNIISNKDISDVLFDLDIDKKDNKKYR